MDTWSFSLWLQQRVTMLGAHLKGLIARWHVNQVFISLEYANCFYIFQCEGSFFDPWCTFKNEITFGPVGYHQQEWYIPRFQFPVWKFFFYQLRTLLFYFMAGLQMLHNMLKQNREKFHRTPIIRKLLKVCISFSNVQFMYLCHELWNTHVV